MIRSKDKAIKSIRKREFNIAGFFISLELEKNPKDQELIFLSLLCSIAKKSPDDAYAIFEVYDAEDDKDDFINVDTLEKMLSYEEYLLEELFADFKDDDGIYFRDFMNILNKNSDFKKVYENIKTSTKLLISSKEDFKTFLDLLVQNGYKDVSLEYAQTALIFFPLDNFFKDLIIKLHKDDIK